MTIEEGLPLARSSLKRALALDEDSTHALRARARLKFDFDNDFQGGKEDLIKAQQIEPGNVSTVAYLAVVTGYLGDVDKAIALTQNALILDPLNSTRYFWLGHWLLCDERYQESEAAIRKAMELTSTLENTYYNLGIIQLLKGRYDLALDEMKKEPQWGLLGSGLAMIYYAMGNLVKAQNELAPMLEEPWGQEYQIAQVYAYWNDIDNAFIRLYSVLENHEAGLGRVKTDLLFRNLHGDPRWDEFLEKIGLAD
jgi:hypothetical protein